MSNDKPVYDLAEYLQTLKYPEQIEWSLNALIEAIQNGDTIKMSCAFAKNETIQEVDHE